jgi:hypothetical protein
MSVQSLGQELKSAGSAQTQAAASAKKALDDQTSSEMQLKGIAEGRYQQLNKIAQDKQYQTYLDSTTNAIWKQQQQYQQLVDKYKNDPLYSAIDAKYGHDAAEKWLEATVKAQLHHEKASASMKEAKKSAEEYNNTIQTVIDKYNQLTMSADDYARSKVWETYQKEAAILGTNNDFLNAWLSLALQKIDTDGEQAKAIEAVTNKYNELTLSAADYQLLKLNDWFKEETEKIGDNAEALEKLNAAYDLQKQKIEELKQKEIWDGFSDGANKEISDIAEHWEKENKKAAEGVQKIWDKAWKNIESDFADTIYDMMDKGIDGFDDFFEKIGSMFKKLLAEMVAAWVVSGLKTLLSGGEGAFSLAGLFGGSKDSATGTATSALSLASLVKSIADLPSTIAAIPSTLMEGLTSIGEAIGLLSVPASTAAAATAQTSTAAAAVAMEKLAEASAGAAASAGAMGAAAETSVASFEALDASLMSSGGAGAAGGIGAAALGIGGMAAAILGIGAIMSGGFDKILAGPTWAIDTLNEIKKAEQGRSEYDKAMIDEWKASLLYQSVGGKQTTDSYGAITWADFDALDFAEKFQSLWDMPIAGLEAIWAEQNGVLTKYTALWESSDKTEESRWSLWNKVFVDFGTEAAGNMEKTLTEKMYDLGFVASKTGWESDATLSMITQLKDSGIAWPDINSTLETYGVTDADIYKRIYAEYHGDSVLTDLASLTAALSAEGISEDILKTIKYIYESNIPLDQMQSLLEWAGLSSEEAARIVGQIDPSDEWKDLVIPVDAPDSIPVAWEDPAGRASGGPVSAGTPYIIGEVGPELFVPQESGHILSNANMKKLMGMGVQGFADGTTDEWKDPFEWMDEINQSDSDNASEQSSKDTKTYESLSEWLDDYNEKLKEWLGTGNDLSDQLDDLNKFYEEQLGYANELAASQDQLDQLAKDQQAAKEKILQDWLDEEIDYYNQMMGLNTELGDSLKEISEHYDTAIEEATSAGATEEQLAEIRKVQMAVTEKALKDWLNEEIDYYNDAMGVSTQYGDALKEISDHYDEAIASAKAAGATEEQLAAIRQVQMAVTEKATKDWAKSTMSSMLDVWESMLKWAQDIAGMTEQQMALTSLMIYRAKKGFSAKGFEDILNIDGMNSDQVEEYVDKLAEYANAVASVLQATYEALKNVKDAIEQNIQDILNDSKSNEQLVNEYVQQIIEGWNALAGLSAEDMPEAIDDLREKVMKYYDLQKKLIEDKYKAEEDKFQDEIEMIKKIRDKIQELTYSSFNLALPNVKVATAGDDYATLLAAAQTGDKDAIERYMAFINTYLQSAQDAYKSSAKYQEIYNQVMEDLKNLDTQQGKTIEDLTEELNRLTEENTKKMQEELNALSKLTVEALKALGEKTDATMNDVVTQLKQIFDLLTAWVTAIYGGGANSTQSSASTGYADGGIATGPYSGYTATLHGTEAIIPLRGGSVPVVISGGGYDDPETKALLKQLVAQGKQKQRVTLALDNGSELSGYIRAEADTVRVAANTRGGSGNRRLYR